MSYLILLDHRTNHLADSVLVETLEEAKIICERLLNESPHTMAGKWEFNLECNRHELPYMIGNQTLAFSVVEMNTHNPSFNENIPLHLHYHHFTNDRWWQGAGAIRTLTVARQECRQYSIDRYPTAVVVGDLKLFQYRDGKEYFGE